MNACLLLRARIPDAVVQRMRIGCLVVVCCLLTSLWLGAAPVPAYATQLLPCNDLLGCIEIPAGQPVVVGGLFDRTGANSVQGVDQARAAALAVQDFGPVLGHTVRLQELDISCQASTLHLEALTATPTLVGFVGPSCNGAARIMLQQNLHRDLPLVSPAATDNALFVSDRLQRGLWQPGFYSVAPSDIHQGVLLARYAYETLGVRTLLVVDDAQPQRDSQRAAMEATFRIYGGQIVGRESLTPGTGPVIPLLERAAALQPDALYLPTDHQDARRLVLAISSMPALHDVLLLVGTDWLAADVAGITRDSSLEIYAAGPYLTPQQANAFEHHWHRNYLQAPFTLSAPHAYDATSLLLQAVRLTAQQDVHGNLSVGRLALRQSLNQMSGFPGYTGVLQCTGHGQCAANLAWGLYRLPTRSDVGAWPLILIQAPRFPVGRSPRYLGRIVEDANVRSGPESHLPVLRTLDRNDTVQIIGTTPNRAWVQMVTGGWLEASHLELYQFDLPAVFRVPSTPLPTPPPAQVGDPDWPVPQAQSFRAPDGMSVRVIALLQEGDPGYSSTVPPNTTNRSQCPLCGHVAVRVGLENTSSVNEHRVYLQDFSLHLVQDRNGFPARIEAAALRCRRRIFVRDSSLLRAGIGEVTRDLCFAVPDVTRVTWLYNLVYESARDPREPHDTPQPEFAVHFSLR